MSVDVVLKALLETIYMVILSGFIAGFFGALLGMYIYCLKNEYLINNIKAYRVISFLINTARSLPFIILMVFIIPFTRWVVGSSIGTTASIVPLTIAAIPFMARLTENAISQVPKGLVEVAKSMGASTFMILKEVIWPESKWSLISGFTITLVNLVGYSAMAGAIGGGGLGDLAIRYGYQRFDIKVMLITILVLIFLVQTIQYIGDNLTKHLKKG